MTVSIQETNYIIYSNNIAIATKGSLQGFQQEYMLVLLKISGVFELNYLAGANGRELGTEGYRKSRWFSISTSWAMPLGKTSYFDQYFF